MDNQVLNEYSKYHNLIQNSNKPIAVILSGAGMSAESGVPTFRDANGLWEGHDVMEVATPTGFRKNPALVLEFYNQRRLALANVQPNDGHKAIAKLEEKFTVSIITQNVDDLHERAGSKNILHIHGELRKVRSSIDPTDIRDIGYNKLEMGQLCNLGKQLRPAVVWFEEEVPLFPLAEMIVNNADIFIVVGTSLQVYPAAGLIHSAKAEKLKYIIDRKLPGIHGIVPNLTKIEQTAASGLPILVEQLLREC